MIKSRKFAVARPAKSFDARALGMAVVSLAAFDMARAAEPAAEPQVMQGVSVSEEVTEEGYKVERASSPKFTQPLLDTPQTITVLNKELLQDRAAATLSEALRNSPGITFTMGENGNTTTGDSVFMRGFDTSGSIFVDGVRDLGTISRDVFNTETIEIVKGPSGSDYGRTAPTGYLNLSSKRPTLEDSVGGSITGGTDSRARATLDVNEGLDIGNAGAALRFNAMYDKGDKLGRDVADSERWGIAPSFALGLGSETRAFFNYLHVDQNNTPDGGIPAIGYPGFSPATTTGTPPVPVPAPVLDAVRAAVPVDISNFYGSPDDFDDVKVDMLTVQLEHDLTSSTTLRNVSRYGRTHQVFELTGINAITIPNAANPATWTVTRSRQGKDQVNEILTNQTGLVTNFATGPVTHDLSSGIELLYERQSNVAFIASGTTTLANLYNPNPAGTDSFAALVRSGAYTDGKTMTGAFYVFDTLHFGEQWLLTAGVRAERYKTEFTSLPATTATPQTATLLDDTDTLLSGKLGLVFKPVPFGSVYATVATSQLPPGGTNFTLSTTATNLNSPNLDPQKALNLEIGTKWDLLENTLVLTAAAYDTTNKNDQAVTDTATGEITQYGEKQVRGVELGASGMITPAWQVSAGVSFMDTEVTEGAVASPQQQGAQINFSPKFAFTSWTTYKLPFGLEIGAGAQYVTSQTTQVNNGTVAITNLPEIPSYWVIDAMASYAISPKLALQLNVNNLADEFYISSVNNGRSRYALGAPRSVLLSANFRF